MIQQVQDRSEVEALMTGQSAGDAEYDALQAQQDHATEIWLMQMANYIQQYAGTPEAQQAIEQLDQYLRSHPNAEKLIEKLPVDDRMALEKALFEERSTNVNPTQEAAYAAQQTQQQAETEQQQKLAAEEQRKQQEEAEQDRPAYYAEMMSAVVGFAGIVYAGEALTDNLGYLAPSNTPDLTRGEGLGINA